MKGRKDRLLKIRGQRVEPAVTEAAMMEHAGVGRCAVSVCGGGSKEKRLVAYYERAGRGLPEASEIRADLVGRIAASHVPTWFVPVEEIPLTSNGKIDYKALPDPSAAGGGGVGRKEARDGLEMELVRIWERVLKIRCGGGGEFLRDGRRFAARGANVVAGGSKVEGGFASSGFFGRADDPRIGCSGEALWEGFELC